MARLLWPVAMTRVCPLDDAVAVDPVVVQERAPGGLGDADALLPVDAGRRADPGRADAGVGQQLAQPFQAGRDLDQPSLVVVEGAGRGAAEPRTEPLQLLVGQGVPILSATLTRASGPTR